jgi:hypothetical protein
VQINIKNDASLPNLSLITHHLSLLFITFASETTEREYLNI